MSVTDPHSLPVIKNLSPPVPAAHRSNTITNPRQTKPPRPSRLGRIWDRVARVSSFPPAAFQARRGHPQSPRLLTHTLTFGCNARCIMCDSWQLPTQGDLTTDEIHSIYKQLPRMDVVRLTGGEPFVRRDMSEITEMVGVYLRPLLIHISSNGFLTDRIVTFCEQRDRSIPLELALSIDGVDGFHDHIRGNSSAFRSVWDTLATLVPRQKELGIQLVVNQTVANNEGLIEYERLHQRLAPLAVEHHLIIAYAESATYSLQRDRAIEFSNSQGFDSFADFEPAALQRVVELAEQHAARLPLHRRVARNYYLRGVRNRLLGDKRTPNPKCQALHTHLRIFPNGDVPVCQFNSQAVGNLRSESFAAVWQSATIKAQRKWVRNCGGCWAECENLPSAIYTLDLLRR